MQQRFQELFNAAVAGGTDPSAAAAQVLTDMNREQQEQKQQQQQQQQQEVLPPPAPASEFCTHRLVVDYVVTVEHFQGRGYASHLLELAVNTARAAGANVYVLALEDSCV